MANKFLRDMIDKLDDDSLSIMADRDSSGEYSDTIDTGSYALNALVSGSIHGGIQDNKLICLAGETQTGKTYYALSIAKNFLDQFPDSTILYIDTESAVTTDMMEARGIDPERVMLQEAQTVEQVTKLTTKILDYYMAKDEADRPKMMFILDSLGNLSTSREMADVRNDEPDMKADVGSRAKSLKIMFRTLTVSLARAHIPLLFTNHIYEAIGGYGDPRKTGGGKGPEYAASTMLFLSKRKEVDKKANEQIGSVITVEIKKGRFTKPGKKVTTLIHFTKGLDRYYGLTELALKAGVFKNVVKRIELPDGRKVFESEIERNPEEYFTPEILEKIESFVGPEYLFGMEIGKWDSESSE